MMPTLAAPRWRPRLVTGAWLLLGLAVSVASGAAADTSDLFASGTLPRLSLTVSAKEMASLRRDSRVAVSATVQDGAETYARVGMHLKGGTGSYRELDDKPALTLIFDKFVKEQRFHGLRKLHLNNSVEDPSYFNEFAGAELFRAAGVPAPRVTQALVELNGRRLGLYVLKEGVAEEFLERQFHNTTGNLYETHPGNDVDEALTKNQGDGPDDRRDLLALAAALREPDLATRWQALSQRLDVERFVSFMAMEVIVCHRDGYCLARNNFRIYHDPATDRLVFLPHGMDQLFGRPDATIRPVMNGLVARALLETPEGRHRYRERLALLTTNTLDVTRLCGEADAFLARARPWLKRGEVRDLTKAIDSVKARITQRRRSLEEQLREPEPGLLPFTNGLAHPTGWKTVNSSTDGTLDQAPAPDSCAALHLRAGPVTSASWRTKVLLLKGHYRFQAAVCTRQIRPLDFGKNQGAGLRVVGGTPSAPYQLLGDQAWTKLEQAFALKADQEVELICELRASAGEAWFDLESLALKKTP